MATRNVKTILAPMKLLDKVFGDIVTNDGYGKITIDDFNHFNGRYVEVLCQVMQRP